MREGLFWFLVALASFAAVPTCAQTITIAGYARSYSGFYFVRTICPQYFQVNIAFASKISADVVPASIATKAIAPALHPEEARRLYTKAKDFREKHSRPVDDYSKFGEILDGKHDDVPEQNFYMKGGIDTIKEG